MTLGPNTLRTLLNDERQEQENLAELNAELAALERELERLDLDDSGERLRLAFEIHDTRRARDRTAWRLNNLTRDLHGPEGRDLHGPEGGVA